MQFRADANPNATTREGGIVVNGERAIVRQAAAPCQIQATISNGQFAAAGGDATVTVTAPGGCAWTASASAGWIQLTPPVSGSGAGLVSVAVAGNTGAARSGTITVGGIDLPIVQAAAATGAPPPPPPGCGISLQPVSVSMPAAGGGSIVAVTTNAGCVWTASSQAPWITITPPASGSGSGSKSFTVAPNPSPTARSGSITIGGATLTVNQAAACVPTINPASQSMAGPGGAGTPIAVTAGTGCAWTAISNAFWLTITSGASGTGNGTVAFSAAPNTTATRTGTLTIAGQTFTVSQAACTYAIDRPSQTIGADGGAGAPVTVTTQPGCPWTSTANASWLHITSGANGTGSGNVTFTVDSSGGVSRTGTLTIAGHTFTVNQERCTATLTPESQSVPASGGSFTVSFATQTGCMWTATSDAVWLTISNGASGIGEKTVNYLVLPNPGGTRSGRLTFVVSGEEERLTVTQQSN